MSIEEIRESGILEFYVIGSLTEMEMFQLDLAIHEYPELLDDINEIEISLEKYAQINAVAPDPTTKPMMIAQLNYTERIKGGEIIYDAPAIHKDSKISDYASWLHRDDMQEPDAYESMYGHIISASEHKSTLIVWLKDGAPDEVHTDELETFLVVEGSCDIIIGDKVNSLKKGDVLSIPLHINHRVEVTSSYPCKIILERKAA